MHTYTQKYAHNSIHAYMYMCTYVNKYMNSHANIAYVRIYICTYVHMYIRTYNTNSTHTYCSYILYVAYVYTYVYAYTYIRIAILIHTLIQTSPCLVMDARHCGSINIVLQREQTCVAHAQLSIMNTIQS